MRSTMLAAAALAAIGLAAFEPAPAQADPILFRADINPLNGSGVSGTAFLTLDEMMLTVRIQASGLEPGMVHPQHIHGRFGLDGEPIDSITPDEADDTDGDGFIELAEGLPDYGPVIIPLTSPPGAGLEGFPTAPDGTIDFEQVYDLTAAVSFADAFTADDLFPLEFREIVLHGMTVPSGIGAMTGGEVDGTNGYLAVLPVAAGVIVQAVPEPGAMALFGGGLVGLLLYRRRRASR